MILYDEQHQIFRLDTPSTSYVMGLVNGRYLGHLYYGKRLEEPSLSYLFRLQERPYTPEVNPREKVDFLGWFPSECPTDGTGDYGQPLVSLRTASGADGLEPLYASHRIFPGKPALPGLPATWGESCETLEITLQDRETGVEIVLSYTAFQDLDAITKSLRIRNGSQEPVDITRALSASLYLEEETLDGLEGIILEGSWSRERSILRQPLTTAGVCASSTRGISSHQAGPFLALAAKSCTQTQGEVYAMNLVYSGSFLAHAATDQFGMTRAVIGIHPERFSWRLEPGDTFQAPEAVLVYSNEGLGKMSRTFHDLYRQHLIRSPWKDRNRPVLINNWEATYFDFNTDKLLDLAREAAACGVEMFVLDDGWFGHRDDDHSSLGDWFVNETKLPGGLKRLSDEIHALGMKFGLWMEPEMICRDSELCRAHPDWVMQMEGREPGQCREQYLLDLTRQEVRDAVYDQISSVLHSAKIEYVKWDMNRPYSDLGTASLPAHRQGEILHRCMLGLYELQERLVSDFPDLLLENCASGGGRFDPGMLYYSPQIWCSDDTDAIERLSIQEGTALVYPLSCIGAHVSACPNHQTGRITPFATRGVVAMAGTFGYELDVTKLDEKERAQIPQQIEAFHQIQALMREGDYYRLASYRENRLFDSTLVVSRDQSEAVLTYVQVLAEPNRHGRRIRLQGLKEDALYQVAALPLGSAEVSPDPLHESGVLLSGAALMQAGLILRRLPGDYQAGLVTLRQVPASK